MNSYPLVLSHALIVSKAVVSKISTKYKTPSHLHNDFTTLVGPHTAVERMCHWVLIPESCGNVRAQASACAPCHALQQEEAVQHIACLHLCAATGAQPAYLRTDPAKFCKETRPQTQQEKSESNMHNDFNYVCFL